MPPYCLMLGTHQPKSSMAASFGQRVQSGAITSIASLIFTDPSFKDDVKSEPVIQINSIGNDYMLKVRKPYTITKQREKWTEDEHQMLLQALKLYGRGWRQIKEHIGTKTAVQIRSHAQKFFSKVVRGSSGCEGTMKPIEIPPPRPKRKPLHPYPRKLKDTIEGSISNQSERSSSPNLSIAEKGTRSPTSLVSTIDSERIGFAASDQPNKYPSSTPCMTDMQSICPCQIKRENDHMTSNSISVEYKVSLPSIQLSACVRLENFLSMLDAQKSESGCKEPNCPESESSNNSPNTSIKLFGRTLLVLEPQKESLMGAENTNFQIPSDNQNGFPLKDPVMSSDDLDTQLSLGGNVSCWNPSVYGFSINHSEHQKQSPSSSEARAPVLCWPFATKYHLPPNRI